MAMLLPISILLNASGAHNPRPPTAGQWPSCGWLYSSFPVCLSAVSQRLTPCHCQNVETTQSLAAQFIPVTAQSCVQCPTTTVTTLSQILSLTEITVTSSTIYCPTSGTYTCPTGTIIPASVPCYNTWSASCTIERALPYSDYVLATAGGTVTVDTEV